MTALAFLLMFIAAFVVLHVLFNSFTKTKKIIFCRVEVL